MKRSRALLSLMLLTAIGITLTGCGPYNRLVALEEAADSAWSQVENV